ncbi:MAG TPA: Dam family site-specific DNA-(adenine-N6)-methyltransferase [Verrucomicrobiae bacterium]|nr:Dam family site-specific DNA-(adenine-N6)-methyltransferase [Verrucomicrobiae bacterium]
MKSEESPSSTPARPFIKWAGGKRWLAAHVEKIKPKAWNGRYFEPFVGGGALFFALQPKKATLSDANKELIATYLAIRNNPDDVIQLLQSFPFGKRFFYRLRDQNPRAGFTIAARFLYLNRTCWNGLYRVTNQGRFNTPFGRYENPTICDEERIRTASELLKRARLFAGDFEVQARKAKAGDFVYFDPPYITGHQNNGFHKYNSQLFSWKDQERLARLAIQLTEKGVHVLVSNADHDSVVRLYEGFRYHQINRLSLIGGQMESRGVVTEALLSNYKFQKNWRRPHDKTT